MYALKSSVGKAVRIHANLKIIKCILRNKLTAVYEGKQWSESWGTGFCCIEVTYTIIAHMILQKLYSNLGMALYMFINL